MATFSIKELEDDPRLFLYTSLTAGSSHIITATSRMETILKANRIPFQAIDMATDEKARRLWQRRAGGRKLPGLVKDGFVIGDLNEVEEWNEFGELKENIGPVPENNAAPPGGQVGVNIAPSSSTINPIPAAGTAKSAPNPPNPPINKSAQPVFDKTKAIALPGAAEMAARNKAAAEAKAAARDAKDAKEQETAKEPEPVSSPSNLEAINPETRTSSPEDRRKTVSGIKESAKDEVAGEPPSAPTPSSKQETPISEPSPPATTATSKHRGSDVVQASAEEIKKIEPQMSLREEDEEDEEEQSKVAIDEKPSVNDNEQKEAKEEQKQPEEKEETPGSSSKGIADLKLEDEPTTTTTTITTQEQEAKEPKAAGESVED